MTIKHLFPVAKPTLDLNFAAEQTLDPRITFTRSSVGTYIDSRGLVQTAVDDEPRFDHDPETGESLGLLIEESRTNIITHSEQFDNAVWQKAACTVTANATEAPDGTTTADLIVEDNADSEHRVSFNAGTATSPRYFSFFAKPAGRNIVVANVAGVGGASFDLINNTATSGQSFPCKIDILPNGWRRCSVYYSTSANAPQIILSDDGVFPFNYQGDGTSGIYLWGAQLEAGSFPTSYIATTGTVETRAADVCSITGTDFSSWYNQNEGTVALEIKPPILGLNKTYYIFNGNSSTQRILCYMGTTASPTLYVNNGGLASLSLPAMTPNTKTKLAHSWSQTDVAGASNGVLSGPISASPPTTITSLDIAMSSIWVPTSTVSMHLYRFAYYPRRLTDEQLEALTS